MSSPGRVQALAQQVLSNLTGSPPTVAVTGAAGYVGGWIVKTCLERGHHVRACVRNVADQNKVAFLKQLGAQNGNRLTLCAADMSVKGNYDDIFKGCEAIFHPAEIFMTFAPGRDLKQSVNKVEATGGSAAPGKLHDAAMQSSQYVVDSINASGTVKLLVYTSSILAMMDSDLDFYRDDPIVDERRHPGPCTSLGPGNYNVMKDATEKFFFEAASASAAGGSGGQAWAAVSANPTDVIGPILSKHQKTETWQGKIAGMLIGETPPQEDAGTLPHRRPWFTVDVRDVAESQVRILEQVSAGGGGVASGQRFLLTDMTRIHPEDIGARINDLFPQYNATTSCTPEKKVPGGFRPVDPLWDRIQTRNDRAREALGIKFTAWDDTIKATVESLVNIGGVVPRHKNA